MKKYLFLNEMLTPKILDILYWIITVLVVFSGLVMMVAQDFFQGLGLVIGGVIVVRIYFELMYVTFGIYLNTKKIADKM